VYITVVIPVGNSPKSKAPNCCIETPLSLETTLDKIPQLSVAPGTTQPCSCVQLDGAALIVRLGGQVIVGGTVSSTVTEAVQVLKFIFTSVTVRVTVFGPAMFEQV
jgi:hypothetical protein